MLAEDLGIACDNTAKWLHEHDRGRAAFRKGQLVIIDEATLAGTLTLDRLTGLAAEAGAKVLLVGDWAQLQSVDAGGAFALLADARDDTPELTEVHRFTHEWEKTASLDLRLGRTEAIGTYVAPRAGPRRHHRRDDRRRLRSPGGPTSEPGAAACWSPRRPRRSTSSTSVPAPSGSSTARPTPSREVELADGASASVGDLVITRHNDRRLRTLRGGWVRNGDRWQRHRRRTPTARSCVRRLGAPLGRHRRAARRRTSPSTSTSATPSPPTAPRASPSTPPTSSSPASTTRENLYVSMTRGRDSNIAYVALDKPDDTHAAPHPDDVTARTVLLRRAPALRRRNSRRTRRIEAEQERWSSIAQLAAEYETIAAVAQRDRWVALLRGCGPDRRAGRGGDRVRLVRSAHRGTAPSRGATTTTSTRCCRRLVAQRTLDDAEDIGAVLISRLQPRDIPVERWKVPTRPTAHRRTHPRRQWRTESRTAHRPDRAPRLD